MEIIFGQQNKIIWFVTDFDYYGNIRQITGLELRGQHRIRLDCHGLVSFPYYRFQKADYDEKRVEQLEKSWRLMYRTTSWPLILQYIPEMSRHIKNPTKEPLRLEKNFIDNPILSKYIELA